MRSPFMLIGTALISLFLLSACDDQSEEANSCRYYVQQDLDNQNYDSAISRLNSGTCQNTYPDNEHYVDLAAAYLGKSGFTFPKILSAALEDGDDDALSAFTKEISELKNDDSFEYLDLAEEAFINYLGNSCNNLNNKTKSQEGVCLIQGVLSVTKTALALDFLAGDLGIEDSETLDLSACALSYSISGNDNSCPTGVKVKVTASPIDNPLIEYSNTFPIALSSIDTPPLI